MQVFVARRGFALPYRTAIRVVFAGRGGVAAR